MLLFSLAIDGVGCLSYALPGIGEAADVVWAPASAFAIRYVSGASILWAVTGFVEEVLPFVDIIPTATLVWFAQ